MNNSENSSSMPPSNSKIWIIAVLVLLFIGFMDATYLTVAHYTGENLKCAIGDGCDIVTSSKYSTVSGVPISLAGAVYYLTVFLLVALSQILTQPKLLKLATLLVGLAFLVSLVLVYLQVFVIEALCQYCLVSAGITTLVLVLLIKIKKLNKKE